jgi:hypothetical protein
MLNFKLQGRGFNRRLMGCPQMEEEGNIVFGREFKRV